MTVAEAAKHGDVEQLRALLGAGGDPNEAETEEHWPPLLEAAYNDHAQAARLLLDAGAEMYAPDSGGETPLLVAVQQGSQGVFRLLLERGYQMDAKRDNATWMLTQAACHGHLEIVRWLLAQGVEVDATDDDGGTALTHAVHSDQLEVVEELLRSGADPSHRDSDTETVLMWAADHPGNAAVLRALIQAGADVNAVNDFDGTALSWVMRHGDPEMARVLLDAGTVASSDALIIAAYRGYLPAVRLLLERGADCTSTDSNGTTALVYAKNRGHREVAKLLRQAEEDHRLRATGAIYPPRRYIIGTHIRTLTGTPREGWIVLVEWHHRRGEWGYFIEVAGKNQARKTVSNRYWEEDLEVVVDEHTPEL
jgi:ankyrin repeat protein